MRPMTNYHPNSLIGGVSRLVREGISTYRYRCIRLLVYGGAGSIAQAAALLLLIPILRSVSPTDSSPYWQVPVEQFSATTYWLYVLCIAALFALSVWLKFLNFSIAFDLSKLFTADCAESAVRALRNNSADLPSSPSELRPLVNSSLFRAPNACGILLRQFLLAINDMVLAAILVAVLIWLNPLAAAAVILLSIPPIFLYARSYGDIARKSDNASESREKSKEEMKRIVDALRDENTSDGDIRGIVRELFDDGLTGQALSEQIQVRQQMRGSGALVELLTPIGILVVAGLVYFSDILEMDLAVILVYYLVLRQLCASVTQIADTLIMASRFYPSLRDYVAILYAGIPTRAGRTTDS